MLRQLVFVVLFVGVSVHSFPHQWGHDDEPALDERADRSLSNAADNGTVFDLTLNDNNTSDTSTDSTVRADSTDGAAESTISDSGVLAVNCGAHCNH